MNPYGISKLLIPFTSATDSESSLIDEISTSTIGEIGLCLGRLTTGTFTTLGGICYSTS